MTTENTLTTNWEEAYFDTLASLQLAIANNVKLKEEIKKLKWAATQQD
jgi:hypothetical protein